MIEVYTSLIGDPLRALSSLAGLAGVRPPKGPQTPTKLTLTATRVGRSIISTSKIGFWQSQISKNRKLATLKQCDFLYEIMRS